MVALHTSSATPLGNLTESLIAASSSFPAEAEGLVPPPDGISLLDIKNEILLSYLQNLVFLLILKIRGVSDPAQQQVEDMNLNAAVIKKLVELRVYTEKGVRPLEGRLKYQIDKVLLAADDAKRHAPPKNSSGSKKVRGAKATDRLDNDESDSEISNSGSDGRRAVAEPSSDKGKIDELSYRPNIAALVQKSEPTATKTSSSRSNNLTNGTYKPPRITPVVMPRSITNSKRDKEIHRRQKSYLLDEYVISELSSAPIAEPSIGSNNTILKRGRGSNSARDHEKQKERSEYEERNLSRLPDESKADRRKARGRGELERKNQYGGEDWSGLGEMGDRVARSVDRRGRSGAGVLERREKRQRENGAVTGAGALGIGDNFEKKRRVMAGRAERKGRKR